MEGRASSSRTESINLSSFRAFQKLEPYIDKLARCPRSHECLHSITHFMLEIEASHAMREIGPLSCLNEDVPILNFDFDLKLRDERCALCCVLHWCASGKLVIKEFVYTSRVQLKRDEFGQSIAWGDSLAGVRSDFMNESERKATCSECGLDPDFLKVFSMCIPSNLFGNFCAVESS